MPVPNGGVSSPGISGPSVHLDNGRYMVPLRPGPTFVKKVLGGGDQVSSNNYAVFEDTLQFRQRLVGVAHLDGAHAQGAGRLEVDPEVIEEDRLLGLHADRRAGEFIEPGIWLPYPQDPRFEHGIE
jgi:hypothetical protein